MNRLEFRYYYLDKPVQDGYASRNISYHCTIDGQPFYTPLDFSSFVDSTKRDGEYFLVTCTCGEPGCAGIFDGVLVTHEGELVRWKVPNPIQRDDDSDEDAPITYDEYVFDRAVYIATIREALNQLKNIVTTIRSSNREGISESYVNFVLSMEV